MNKFVLHGIDFIQVEAQSQECSQALVAHRIACKAAKQEDLISNPTLCHFSQVFQIELPGIFHVQDWRSGT
jgi:hypothetical protein